MAVDIVLQRDTVAKPWGFRLQGGRESQAPLTIQRVFVGSASDGRLQRGDVILAIDGYDASQMYHHDADSMIQQARNSLSLTVQRGGASSYIDSPSADQAYYQNPSSGPSSWPADNDVEDYSSRSVSQIRQKFVEPPVSGSHRAGVINMNPAPGMPSYVPKRPAMWQKKEPTAGALMEFGWAPNTGSNSARQQQQAAANRRYYPATKPSSPPVNRVPQQMAYQQPTQQQNFEPPAWAGSLRRSGGVKMWEMEESEVLAKGGAPIVGKRYSSPTASNFVPQAPVAYNNEPPVTPHNPRLQSMRYGPSGASTYEQHDPSAQVPGANDSARVAHLQYNSPLGLYSRNSAQEALQAQTRGKVGQGTMQITGDGQGAAKAFDPAHSSVFRMVAAEDQGRASRQYPPPRSAAPSSRPHQGISDF